MDSHQIKEEYSENFRLKPLADIKKEVKEELIAEEEVESQKGMNLEEYNAIKKLLSSASVRRGNVDQMREVFKVVFDLEAHCGAETDLAKKEDIKKEVKEELVTAEEEEGQKEMNGKECNAIKELLSTSNVRKRNVDQMGEVFKMLLNLEAHCGAETDLAKRETEELKRRLKAKETELLKIKMKNYEIRENFKPSTSLGLNMIKIIESLEDDGWILREVLHARYRANDLQQIDYTGKINFHKSKRYIRLKYDAWEQEEVGLKENIELKDIKSNQMSTGSKAGKHQPFGQGISKKAIRKRKIREAKEGKSQSQKNVNESSSATQNSESPSTEPAEKKMRTSHDQEPIKSLKSTSQPLVEGVHDIRQLPGCLLLPPPPPPCSPPPPSSFKDISVDTFKNQKPMPLPTKLQLPVNCHPHITDDITKEI